MGLQVNETAEQVLGHNFLERFEISIVAAVVKNAADQVFGSGERQQFLGFFRYECDGLIHDHMLSGEKALLRHGKMKFIWRSDADQIGRIGRQEGFQTLEGLHLGILLLTAEAISLDYGDEVQGRANFQEWSMHFFSNGAVANQGCTKDL
jgi:hypothetical protein